MIKVLFVCLGNICRSPLAEGIFRKLTVSKELDDILKCDSAGTSNYHIGGQPDRRTVANALKNGISLNHKARQFTSHDFDDFDYILAMDSHNKSHIMNFSASKTHRNILLIRNFDPEDKGGSVPDPYYGGDQGFQEVFEILDRSNRNFLEFLIDQHQLHKG